VALTGTIALGALSPIAAVLAAMLQLRNDDSDFSLRLKHFGITVGGIVFCVLAVSFFQPGFSDGFGDGDWYRLFFGN